MDVGDNIFVTARFVPPCRYDVMRLSHPPHFGLRSTNIADHCPGMRLDTL